MKLSILKITYFLLLLALPIYGADYKGYAYEFFFGRMPSASSEAMGRSGVAQKLVPFSANLNPSSLSFSKGLDAFYSYSKGYYRADNARFNNFSLSYSLNNIGTVGLSYYNLSYNFDDLFMGAEGHTPDLSMYTLSFAHQIGNNFSMGVNANLFQERYNWGGNDTEISNAWPIDIGLLKIFTLVKHDNSVHNINIGVNYKNIFGSNVRSVFDYDEILPQTFTLGASYNWLTNESDFIINLDYQNVFNSEFDSGVKVGTEANFFNWLALRTGHYYFKGRDDCNNCRKFIQAQTYGLGIITALPNFDYNNDRLILKLDYTLAPQPTYVTDASRWDHVHLFTLALRYIL